MEMDALGQGGEFDAEPVIILILPKVFSYLLLTLSLSHKGRGA
jgi:hypothetical protein